MACHGSSIMLSFRISSQEFHKTKKWKKAMTNETFNESERFLIQNWKVFEKK